MDSLFLAMNIPIYVPILFFILGITLMVIEIFQPGFGVFGITGAVCLVGGLVMRILAGGTWGEIVLIIVIIALVLGIVMAFAIKSAKNGRISRSALILSETAIPADLSEITADNKFLIGGTGVAITFLRPVGKAKFGGEIFEVISENADVIEKDEEVKVVSVEGKRIIVKKI